MLYSNTSGTTGNVTLSESSANFDYLEIFFKCRGWEHSQKVENPNGKTIISTTSQFYNGQFYLYNKRMDISGTTITNAYSIGCLVSDGSTFTDTDNHVVVKVIGYK